jgi:hypothetical protein
LNPNLPARERAQVACAMERVRRTKTYPADEAFAKGSRRGEG